MKWSGNDSYATPEYLFHALNDEFDFSLDPCPLNPDWPKTGIDGLQLDWNGQVVFCNPPWSDIMPWVNKALTSKCLTVFLLPARTDTAWFHKLYASRAVIRFFRKRVHFIAGDMKKNPTDGTMVAIIRNN
jgi:DNA N-6-adenine-methyltransferase (Dam)